MGGQWEDHRQPIDAVVEDGVAVGRGQGAVPRNDATGHWAIVGRHTRCIHIRERRCHGIRVPRFFKEDQVGTGREELAVQEVHLMLYVVQVRVRQAKRE